MTDQSPEERTAELVEELKRSIRAEPSKFTHEDIRRLTYLGHAMFGVQGKGGASEWLDSFIDRVRACL